MNAIIKAALPAFLGGIAVYLVTKWIEGRKIL